MRIPYVIDNQQHRLADVLNEVLAEHTGRSLDVSTACLFAADLLRFPERWISYGGKMIGKEGQ